MTTAPKLAREVFNPEHRANPYPLYAALRETDPVHSLGPRTYLASHHADCNKVLTDPLWGHGYNDRISPFRPGVGRDDVPGSLLGMDPPDHTRLDRLVGKAFKPEKIAAMHARTERIVDELLDAALEANEVDLVAAFNSPLPLRLVCEPTRTSYRRRSTKRCATGIHSQCPGVHAGGEANLMMATRSVAASGP
ncbi:hypothetical protein ACWEC7_28250, partial [Streptomyces sp. NPDC005046]